MERSIYWSQVQKFLPPSSFLREMLTIRAARDTWQLLLDDDGGSLASWNPAANNLGFSVFREDLFSPGRTAASAIRCNNRQESSSGEVFFILDSALAKLIR